MSEIILHKDGAYNIYGTIADAPYFDSALSLDQLTAFIELRNGKLGLEDLPPRLEKAHRNGTSCIHGTPLAEFISCNRAGENEACMPFDEFVQKYLTRAPREDQR